MRAIGLRLATALIGTLVCGATLGCAKDEPAPLDRLLLPTGLAEDPAGTLLFVTNGNWDLSRLQSSLVVIDLDALDAGLSAPRDPGQALDRDRPCRSIADSLRLECDPSLVIEPELGVRLPSGAGNIGLDRPAGEQGPLRLLIPTRLSPTLSWVDVTGAAEADTPTALDCGQREDRFCDEAHRIRVEAEPSRITVDNQGYRYAYLPHLLFRRLTLLDLDTEFGPRIVDVEQEFFREDELFDSGLGGGFSVVQRACDVESDNAPSTTLDCVRPYMLASQRYWWGVRNFRVAPGIDVVVAGGDSTVIGPNLEAAEPKPLMGGMAFEDPEIGNRLLVVHTTPPALSRVDTSLNDAGNPRVDVLDTLSLCGNPNLIVVHRPADTGGGGPPLAAISCYGSDQVAIVDLNLFRVVETIDVGDGPNELLLDALRGYLFVANTAESTISIIDLDPTRVTYLSELATLGLNAPR